MHLHQLSQILLQKPNDILGYHLQHYLGSNAIILLSELLILIGDQIRPGVIQFPTEDLMQFIFVGEVERAIEVVVELAIFEGVVIAGFVDIRPEEIGLVFGCSWVGLPADAGQVCLEVFLHVVFIVQEADALWFSLG